MYLSLDFKVYFWIYCTLDIAFILFTENAFKRMLFALQIIFLPPRTLFLSRWPETSDHKHVGYLISFNLRHLQIHNSSNWLDPSVSYKSWVRKKEFVMQLFEIICKFSSYQCFKRCKLAYFMNFDRQQNNYYLD